MQCRHNNYSGGRSGRWRQLSKVFPGAPTETTREVLLLVPWQPAFQILRAPQAQTGQCPAVRNSHDSTLNLHRPGFCSRHLFPHQTQAHYKSCALNFCSDDSFEGPNEEISVNGGNHVGPDGDRLTPPRVQEHVKNESSASPPPLTPTGKNRVKGFNDPV